VNARLPGGDVIAALALLDEPNRRRLYDHVAASQQPVGRDEAATELGISRELAAFHLDRLATAGLLATEYRRLSGRTGPGAGRPAKLYRRADRDIAVSVPTRRYDSAASVFAQALDVLEEGAGARAAADVARERGREAGVRGASRSSGAERDGAVSSEPVTRASMDATRTHTDATSADEALLAALATSGYEPVVDTASDTIYLRNCPYRALVATHRPLVCGTNVAWAEGLIEGIGVETRQAALEEAPGRCCVVFRASGVG
jgi:predicted ArsR family transcriptional regulator